MKSSNVSSPIPLERPPAMLWRVFFLCAFLLAAALLYAGAFGALYTAAPQGEQTFAGTGSLAAVNVYVDMLEMDPVREELQVRLDFAIVAGPHGAYYAGAPDRDMTIRVGDGASVREISLRAGRNAPSVTLRATALGSVGDYPLDAYNGHLSVSAVDADGAARPVRVTLWPVMSGWVVGVDASGQAEPNPGGVNLGLRIVRPTASIVIAGAVYGAMALVGLSGLAIGGLVFVGLRKIEATLTSALGAMVFAVPALRGAMPGAPPLGGHADVLVFVWVELAVILGLTLFVIAWATRGPPP